MSTGARRSRHGGLLFVILLVGVLVLVALVAGSPRRPDRYLDPKSPGPHGLKAMRDLVVSFGATFTVTSDPVPDADVMLIAIDTVPDEALDRVQGWVDGGGVVVVTDPTSAFVPTVSGTGPMSGGWTGSVDRGRCDVAALEGLGRVEPGEQFVMYDTYGLAGSCFGGSESAFVAVERQGSGAVVSVGSPTLFMNSELGNGDNAALAVALLAPVPGTRVAMFDPEASGLGSGSLSDAMPERVRLFGVELIVAFLVYVAFRAKRLGRPVTEAGRVQLAGSELVVAVGSLLEQSKDPAHAAVLMRDELRTSLCTWFGLAPGTATDVIAGAARDRSTVSPERISAALDGPSPATGAQLAVMAGEIESIRKEILDGTS